MRRGEGLEVWHKSCESDIELSIFPIDHGSIKPEKVSRSGPNQQTNSYKTQLLVAEKGKGDVL